MTPPDLTLTVQEQRPRPARAPSVAALAEALASNPNELLVLVRDLPIERRQACIAQALGRAIAEVTKEVATPLVRQIVEAEAPKRAERALDAATAEYQWSGGRYSSLAEWCRGSISRALADSVAKRAGALVEGLMSRVRLEVEP